MDKSKLNIKPLKKAQNYTELLQALYEQGYKKCEMQYDITQVCKAHIKTIAIKFKKRYSGALEISDFPLSDKYIIFVYDIRDDEAENVEVLY